MTPLILTIYNRPRFLETLIEYLRPRRPRDIYVFSDGAVKAEDALLVDECRELVSLIDWTTPTCIFNQQHYGCADSIRVAISNVLMTHDRFIILEDDCLPGPRFFDFIEACLDKYEEDPRVGAISGCLRYVMRLHEIRPWEDCKYNAFFFPIPETWGWAGWKRTWKMYKKDTELAAAAEHDLPHFSKQLIKLRTVIGGDVWSPGLHAGLGMANATVVYPTISHIWNMEVRPRPEVLFLDAPDNFNLPNIGENCQSAVDAMKAFYEFDK